MTKLINHKTNFTAGEVSADLLGRTDLSAYDNGAMELKNVFISPIGGVRRRSGLRYIDTAAGAVRLLSFAFNTEQTYLFVLGDKFIRIYKNETLLQTLVTPWSGTEVKCLRWTQSADTLLLTHPAHPPKRITRQANETFSLSDWQFDQDKDGRKLCPFERFAADEITLTPSGTTGTITLTASADVFSDLHVGTRFRLQGGEVEITATQSATVASATVKKTLSGAGATKEWTEEAFSAAHGYPVCVTFYQGRLVIGGSRDLPNKLWFSKSFLIMNFDTGTGLDDEAMSFSILSDQVNAICALMSGRHLQVFTTGSEWMVSGDPLTPQSIQLKRQTKNGSYYKDYVPPVDVSGATLFATANGREIREFLFEDLEQAYQAKNLSLIASHIVRDPVDMDYDAKRRLVYVIMQDGTMGTLTNYRSEQVSAWSRQETQGQFLSVCVIADKVYFLIRRDDSLFLEAFDDDISTDCALTGQDSEAHSVWTGLTPLVGKHVKILADDILQPDEDLTSASLTLAKGAKKIEVGLPFEHKIVPLPPTLSSSVGSMPVKAVRLVEARFKVVNTLSLCVDVGCGVAEHLIKKFNAGYVLDSSDQAQTTDIVIHALGWVRNGVSPLWQVISDAPKKCQIVSVTSVMKVSE